MTRSAATITFVALVGCSTQRDGATPNPQAADAAAPIAESRDDAATVNDAGTRACAVTAPGVVPVIATGNLLLPFHRPENAALDNPVFRFDLRQNPADPEAGSCLPAGRSVGGHSEWNAWSVLQWNKRKPTEGGMLSYELLADGTGNATLADPALAKDALVYALSGDGRSLLRVYPHSVPGQWVYDLRGINGFGDEGGGTDLLLGSPSPPAPGMAGFDATSAWSRDRRLKRRARYQFEGKLKAASASADPPGMLGVAVFGVAVTGMTLQFIPPSSNDPTRRVTLFLQLRHASAIAGEANAILPMGKEARYAISPGWLWGGALPENPVETNAAPLSEPPSLKTYELNEYLCSAVSSPVVGIITKRRNELATEVPKMRVDYDKSADPTTPAAIALKHRIDHELTDVDAMVDPANWEVRSFYFAVETRAGFHPGTKVFPRFPNDAGTWEVDHEYGSVTVDYQLSRPVVSIEKDGPLVLPCKLP